MRRFAAAVAVAVAVIAGVVGCREPAAPAPRVASVPDPEAALLPADAGAAVDAAPSAWQARCLAALEAGRPAAAAHAAELASAFLRHSVLGNGSEEVSMTAHAPYHDVAPTYVVIERGAVEPAEPDAAWRIVGAESRDGRYFVIHARNRGRVSARVSLEGWDPRAAERLAPVLTAVADRCFD